MAPGLNLPAPKNSTDDAPQSSKAATIEDVDDVTEQSSGQGAAAKYATGGIIYPPPELRAIVDKTANYVARNGTHFEGKIREDGAGSNRFAFLNDDDPYNAYYRAKIQAINTGQGPLSGDVAGPRGDAVLAEGEASADLLRQKEEYNMPREPEPYAFSVDLPSITALDLDIVKLTALFVAQKGRSFATDLAAKEGKSYQFEFLRPTHSLFGFFNRLVEQYRAVMRPRPETLERIKGDAFGTGNPVPPDAKPALGIGRGGARLQVLGEIQQRADWQRFEQTQKARAEDEEAQERAAFNEIDWNDFVVAGTVEITETDAHIDLPPPMSLREVRNMSIAQKRMASMIMETEERPEHEVAGTQGRMDRPEKPSQEAITEPVVVPQPQEKMDLHEEEETPKQAIVQGTPSTGPIKVRKGYQAKTLAERKAAAAGQSSVCPVCGETVLSSEMDEHIRIELSNPQYREQRQDLERRKAEQSALMEGANPSQHLKQFAGKRTDIFGGVAEEEAQRRREQEEARKRKERESIVWDGHAASRADTAKDFHNPHALQEDATQIAKRFKMDQSKTYVGPQVGYAPDQSAGYDFPQTGSALGKRSDGQLYGEAQWYQSHPAPIYLYVQLPNTPSVSPKCDGSQLVFSQLHMMTTVGAIRDRIQSETFGGTVGANRLKLRIDGKATTLRQTLAYWNLVDGDVLVLSVS